VALDDEITASLQAIKELQFDHQAGSLSDDDFQRMERAERANAARLIRRRSELDGDS
jgi:molecular chaperone DnaK (HSP70)